ncbi:Helitron helicase [Phytophthora megakarya]|uniref:ATP-dependent DNA helicase n=1 Tax=Phytophthora megakarya TaxID=4795 RepID=A0A225WCE3_9STRA|nr:Helitron helicase [Phytophthora megakarya]
MPYQLRQLFGTILVYSLPGIPLGLWEHFKSDLSEDFLRELGMDADVRKVGFKTMKSLNNILRVNGKTLESYVGATAAMVIRLNPNLQDNFDHVISAVESPEVGQKLFFDDGPGGTGKLVLLVQLLAKVRLEGGVAIVVASSGIATTLLTGGRTAHSMFRIPLQPNEHSTCGANDALVYGDRTFRDIMDNDREPFGGKAIVFSRDYRQIPPVLKDATRAETLKACFKASPQWRHLKKVLLFENIRVRTAPDPDDAAELAEFSEFLLQFGEGRFPVNHEGDICHPRDICVFPEIPDPQVSGGDGAAQAEVEFPNFTLLQDNAGRRPTFLIDAVYPRVGDENLPDQYLVDRAIMAPTNPCVMRINEMVAERLSGETKEYLSNDSLEGPGDESLFEPEFLNSLNFSGMPPHKLILKVGTSVTMIRNLNSDNGLCNGTRLRVVAIREKCIDATTTRGDKDKEFPFTMRRKQFPVVPAFAMTINKAQGQSIHHVGIYLESPVFAHGQLYVALFRVTSRKVIKIAIDPETVDEDVSVHTKHIVYEKFLSDTAQYYCD